MNSISKAILRFSLLFFFLLLLAGCSVKGVPRQDSAPSVSEGASGFIERARKEERLGNYPEAISLYLEAAAEDHDNPMILASLGTAYLKADDLVSARMHLARAIEIDPNHYKSRMGLGFAHLRLGDFDLALDELNMSMGLRPTAEAAFLLGETHESLGKPKEAIEYYRLSYAKDPRSKIGRAARKRLRALGVRL